MPSPTRDDEGEIRLRGSEAFIAAALERIGSAVDVAYVGNPRSNRHDEGARSYARIRLTDRPAPVQGAEPSPREAAELAKADRDLSGELAALATADRELRAQPWFPIQPGDVVCWSIDMPNGGRHGETLVAVDAPGWSTEAGAPLRKVSETPYEIIGAADDASAERDDEDLADGEPDEGSIANYEDFHDVWFEAGPGRVAVIRHGQLVHGTPPAAPRPARG